MHILSQKYNILTVNKTLKRIKGIEKVPGMERNMHNRQKSPRNREKIAPKRDKKRRKN
jgi:hypothetical protein